ncbi:uncharacterized protein LOC142375144 [Odontesthes bonariensis]|uniref:uncharacterized protein LOC142375144 n=1 Tax=Odontesthes bonariensis TaxID=219752 RepID=UPI003F58EA8C
MHLNPLINNLFLVIHRRIPQRQTKEKYALGIITLFPALKDPFSRKGYILQDFTLLFGPEKSTKLLEKWHTSFKGKVLQEAEGLTATPLLLNLLRSARNQDVEESLHYQPEWDSDMASFLLLLHILPPQPAKKRMLKISAAQAMDHLVVFHKSCESFDEHLLHQERRCQPYLRASGTNKQAVSAYYIVVDKKLIPCQGTTALAAIDELFKLHFVFSTSYDNALTNIYTVLQTAVYGIDVDRTKESPKVKELRAKFMNRS